MVQIIEIWAGFGRVGSIEKNEWADYEQLLRMFFHVFRDKKLKKKSSTILVQSVCKYFFSYFRVFLFRYQIFISYFFLSLTFPISLSDFTIELLSRNLITK